MDVKSKNQGYTTTLVSVWIVIPLPAVSHALSQECWRIFCLYLTASVLSSWPFLSTVFARGSQISSPGAGKMSLLVLAVPEW